MATVKDIDALLPQTQCGECSYPGCRPYAEALAHGSTSIDRCPPGGISTVKALGQLLKIDPNPYLATAEATHREPSVAVIREAECIGCTKCIQACPVDAIMGAAKLMHTVISHECTGCGLCVEPCPVDCIDMVTLAEPAYDKEVAREHYNQRIIRLLREQHDKEQVYQEKRKLSSNSDSHLNDQKAKQDYILQALARSQAKKDHE